MKTITLILTIIGAVALITLPLLFLTGCAGSGEGGAWTPEDSRAVIGGARDAYDL